MSDDGVFILSGARLPIGRFLGGLSGLTAPELGARAARAAIERAGADPGEIERRPWGETSFYVRDPWGNALCFAAEGTEFTGARFIR
jgi:acetyl-CoA acetyltransferase